MRSSFSKPSKFLSPVPHNVRAVPSSISLVLQSPSSSFPISFLISFDHPSSSLLLPLLASQPVAEAMDSIAKKTIKVAKVDRRKAICNGFVKGYKEMLQSSDETNDNIDDNTDMEVNHPEIDTTTQNMSSAKERGQRKRGREGDKRIGFAAKLSSQLDHIIQTFESSASA
ncbi:hypothetical protein JHK86_050095 [Glycine max]|nr:hypothetical protein JHK86_050095 [Glycine max]